MVIKQQIAQAEEDIRALRALKEQANSNPTAFIKNLKVDTNLYPLLCLEHKVSEITDTRSNSPY